MIRPPPARRANFADLSPAGGLCLLACNALPLMHVSSLIAVGWALRNRPMVDGAVLLGLLYLLPPLACRVALLLKPPRATLIRAGTGDFFVWWFTANLQVLFCRFPFLDEALRVVPGMYSLWMRLWGSKIGRLTYWSPGTRVLDRSYLRIGHNVTFGAGVRLNGHVLMTDAAGTLQLALAPIEIGDGVMVGGYALLTAGTVVAPGEVTQACQAVPPFTRIEGGRRIKPTQEAPSPTPTRH